MIPRRPAEIPSIAELHNEKGSQTVLVTKRIPGERWLRVLAEADCRVDILEDNAGFPLTEIQLRGALERRRYVGAIGQLNEPWGESLLTFAAERGLRYFSTFAVGYDNIDLPTATRLGIRVGNTPGVLTEATAEIAVALTFAAARRIAEMDAYTRTGRFVGWHPMLGMGRLLNGATVGVVGAGRIGGAYAETMAGHGCSIVYWARNARPELEAYVNGLGRLRAESGRPPVQCRRAESLEDLMRVSDVVSLHCPLTPETRGLIGARELAWMKREAILINTARGPVVDEQALVDALRESRLFAAGFDVYEREPALTAGLAALPNAVLLPHIGSATTVSREGMSLLAAANLRGMLLGYPAAPSLKTELGAFLAGPPLPPYCPSVLNMVPAGTGTGS